MPFKTILVHLADDPGHMQRLETAIALAHRFDAHLTAVYVETPLARPAAVAGRGASLGFQAAASEATRKHAAKVEKEFRERAERSGLQIEWRMGGGEHADAIAAHAFTADLTIISQLDIDGAERRLAIPFPDDVPFVVPGPVLILPQNWTDRPIAKKHVVIGWKPEKEAARAVQWSLPFLLEAANVTIVTLHPDEGDKILYGTEVANMLDRHGVKVDIYDEVCRDSEVGERLQDIALERASDLMVIGAYGHSRLREIILGGTTRHMCAEARIPILMAH